MRPEKHIKEDLDRTVDGASDLSEDEQKLLTLYRELSELDKGFLLRFAEVMTHEDTRYES